jgi:hypothetical protein
MATIDQSCWRLAERKMFKARFADITQLVVTPATATTSAAALVAELYGICLGSLYFNYVFIAKT